MEDSVNQGPSEAGALPRVSGSDYGGKGRGNKTPSRPGVLLVGLMLLVTLPFGASIKQSVPRVKLSHRGKSLNILSWAIFLIVETQRYVT